MLRSPLPRSIRFRASLVTTGSPARSAKNMKSGSHEREAAEIPCADGSAGRQEFRRHMRHLLGPAMPPKPEWRSHARRREQPHLLPPDPHELTGALGGKGGETADVDGQSVLCLERVEPALPGRGITGPLEHPDPDRLEPAAGHVLLGVLRSHPQGRQRRPGDHPMPRQGMDEGLQF